MLDWMQQSFQENSILWLLLSSILGGIIGASMRFVFDVILPQRLQQRRKVLDAKRKYATPILLAAEDLRRRCENIVRHIEEIEQFNWLADIDRSEKVRLCGYHCFGEFFRGDCYGLCHDVTPFFF